ncbi:hypothetical protein BBP40_003935 [Aspergillus hancockii]|nr:hypothetical protein BBP40_003935 [Aspergillus hancockii]
MPWQIQAGWFASVVDPSVNRRLIQYWLEKVSQMLVIDPDNDPFSHPGLEFIPESPSLVHIIQSISARHEQYFSAQVARIVLEEREKALTCFRKELGNLGTRPQLSFLTAMLLAISHAADHDMADFGKWHLFAARSLINQMLQDKTLPWDMGPLNRLCFGVYLYWDMNTAFLVHPDEQPALDRPSLSTAVQTIGLWHHPMYGFGTELIFILAKLGRYCRQVLQSHHKPALMLLYESLRKHSLILLYRICGWNRFFTNPRFEEFDFEPLIHHYALETLNHILQIPTSSNYLNFQSLPLLTAGSELARTDGDSRDDVRYRLRALYSMNRLPSNLYALELLEDIWATRDNGDTSYWLYHMLQKGWLLTLG